MKRFIIAAVLISLSVVCNAQDISTVFANMPDEIIPQFEVAWRKDLVELYKQGKEPTVENKMLGKSTVKKLTDDYLLIQVSERSTAELKLLPLINNTYIVCLIKTAYGPVADSYVSFYTTDWQPLPTENLLTPITVDWFLDGKESDIKYQDAVARLDIPLFKYELDPDKTTLQATLTTPEYLNDEEQKAVAPFLKKEPKRYRWNKTRFE